MLCSTANNRLWVTHTQNPFWPILKQNKGLLPSLILRGTTQKHVFPVFPVPVIDYKASSKEAKTYNTNIQSLFTKLFFNRILSFILKFLKGTSNAFSLCIVSHPQAEKDRKLPFLHPIWKQMNKLLKGSQTKFFGQLWPSRALVAIIYRDDLGVLLFGG